MKMELISWNANLFYPNYKAFIVHPRQLRVNASANYLEVAGRFSEYVGKSFGGGYLTIQVKYLNTLPENAHIREAEIARWFSTLYETPLKLLAQDAADSNRQWYVMATPVSIMQEDDSAVILLAMEEPYWSVETLSTSTWNITASGQTKDITNIGELAKPVLRMYPTALRAGGYQYRRFVVATSPPGVNATNHPIPIGNTFDTAALVTAGKCQASGNDFRVIVDGVEVPRWFGTGAAAFNQTTTKTWIVLDKTDWCSATGTNVIETAFTSATVITEIQLQKNDTTRAFLERLSFLGHKILSLSHYVSASIVWEYFTFTGVDLVNYKITGVTRAAKDTSPLDWGASYGTDGAGLNPGYVNMYSLAHDIWIVYGNPSATAPVYDDTRKPIIDLTNSTISSWYYASGVFYEEGNPLRAGSWVKSQFQSSLGASYPYTGTLDTMASPSTAIGLKADTKLVNGSAAPENVRQAWTLFVPNGATSFGIYTFKKYRTTTDWPSVKLEVSTDGSLYTDLGITTYVSNTPTAAGVWETYYNPGNSSIGGTQKYIRLIQSGSLSAVYPNKAMIELLSCKINMNYVMNSGIEAETLSTYDMDAKLTNVTTGDFIFINHLFTLGQEIVVDCEARTAVYQDGTNALTAITLGSERADWLNFEYGVNQLKYEETGATGVTIEIEWRDRVAL